LTKDSLKGLLDLSARERAIIYPLVILTILFGVYPTPIFNATTASVRNLVEQVNLSISSAAAQAATAAPAAQ
jgi:NADH-quinone oxidoreductase subunit M